MYFFVRGSFGIDIVLNFGVVAGKVASVIFIPVVRPVGVLSTSNENRCVCGSFHNVSDAANVVDELISHLELADVKAVLKCKREVIVIFSEQ